MIAGVEQTPSALIRKIWVYRNGDPHFAGRRVLITDKRFKTMDQLLQALTPDLDLRSGAVRRLFDTKGHKIGSLTALTDNSQYIAAGNEPYRMVTYPLVSNASSDHHTRAATEHTAATDAKTHKAWGDWGLKGQLLIESDNARSDKPIFQPNSRCYKVCIFRNGDLLTPPLKMVLGYRNCRTFDQLLSEITDALKLPEGRVKKLYDAQSYRSLSSLSDVHDGQNIVASGTKDPPRRINYKLVKLEPHDEPRKTTETQLPRGKIITVLRNGDVSYSGLRITITQTRFKDFTKLLEFVNHEVPSSTGKVERLTTLTGDNITNVDELQHGGKYVAISGFDVFQKIRYNVEFNIQKNLHNDKKDVNASVDSTKKRAPTAPAPAPAPGRTKEVLQKAKRQLDKDKSAISAISTASTTTAASQSRLETSSTNLNGKAMQSGSHATSANTIDGNNKQDSKSLRPTDSKEDIQEEITAEPARTEEDITQEFKTTGKTVQKDLKVPVDKAKRRGSDADLVKLQAALQEASITVAKSTQEPSSTSDIENKHIEATTITKANSKASKQIATATVEPVKKTRQDSPSRSTKVDHPVAISPRDKAGKDQFPPLNSKSARNRKETGLPKYTDSEENEQ